MLQLGHFSLGLGHMPGPLEPMARRSAYPGGPKLWIQRGRLHPQGQPRQQTRKLDYLAADALAQKGGMLKYVSRDRSGAGVPGITVGPFANEEKDGARLTGEACMRRGRFGNDANLVFVHTGGQAGLVCEPAFAA